MLNVGTHVCNCHVLRCQSWCQRGLAVIALTCHITQSCMSHTTNQVAYGQAAKIPSEVSGIDLGNQTHNTIPKTLDGRELGWDALLQVSEEVGLKKMS